MRFGILSSKGWFSPALFRKNTTRFWPLWLFYGAVQFFLLPLDILMAGSRTLSNGRTMADYLLVQVRDGISMAPIPAIFFGCLYAMALFSYLMNGRSVGMLHALPVRREGLFLTNYTSGLCFFLVPDLVLSVISILGAAALGVNLIPEMLWWLFIQVLVGMFFFSFAVCCAMFTGHILALPIFYGILNFLVAGLSFLGDLALNVLLIGYGGTGFMDSNVVEWCTPVWNLIDLLSYRRAFTAEGELLDTYVQSNAPAAVGYCIVLFAVFTSIAVGVYRLRELERAGDVVTVAWVRPVFQYGLGFCTGLLGGCGLYEKFFSGSSVWAFIALAVVSAIVGAFAGRMLLKKTLHVFADGWKGPAVLGVCMLLLLVGARMDFFGYQRWVPDPAKVESVLLSDVLSSPDDTGRYASVRFEEPEDVAALVEFHRALTADLNALRQAEESGLDPWSSYYGMGNYDTMAIRRVWLNYTMTDGTIVRRQYAAVPIAAGDLDDQETCAAKLEALINRPEAVRQGYVGDQSVEKLEAVGAWLSNINGDKVPDAGSAVLMDSDETYVEYTDGKEVYSTRSGEYTIKAGYTKLWDAVKADLAAGNIGRRYLLNTEERYDNCYQTDLGLTLLYSWTDREGQRQSDTWQVRFTIQKSATETLKALEELGLTELLVPWELEK